MLKVLSYLLFMIEYELKSRKFENYMSRQDFSQVTFQFSD